MLKFTVKLCRDPESTTPDSSVTSSNYSTLDEVTRNHVLQVLKKTNGKIHGKGGAAEILGITANTLRNRMSKLGIDYKKQK